MMSLIWNRRGFLKKSVLTSLSGALGLKLVHAEHLPKGVKPLIMDDFLPGKHPELIILQNRPWNVETPAHLLDEEITSADKMFIRNNGQPPEAIDEANWKLTISGESVLSEKTYSLADLKAKFESHSYQLTLECGGNGRSGFYPPASGNQWAEGAVSCGKWTGVRLRDLLNDAGLKADAVYIGYYGADTHLSGDPEKVTISRGVPIAKAMEDETLVAWALNGEPIPYQNGFPLRLVIGGWPASVSGKWLQKIVVRNIIHDGEKMGGDSYRVPKYPIAPGEKIPMEDFKIIESMPVKSVLTYPKTGAMLSAGKTLAIRGKAWAGDLSVVKVEVSVDYGSTWQSCELGKPANRLAWQSWKTDLKFKEVGYYEIWAKATDENGRSQPMVIPGWNPKGYLNNACHRIAVKVKNS